MVKRPTCLCDGRLIGIESIFTIDADGKQINIKDKLEALRRKSKNNELLCPCGCGANLTLVAGDRGVRSQHFRLRDDTQEKECQYVSEGDVSICSKIVLKCWLEDKLSGDDVETRVPIGAVDGTNRKYEMTLLAKQKKVAISYCHDRANLSDEKLDILDGNAAGIALHYIVDIENTGNFTQYPEMMMKVQKRQGYCLFLHLPRIDFLHTPYDKAELRAFYCCQENSRWSEIEIISDKLSAFSFGMAGDLVYHDTPLAKLKEEREQARAIELERERQERERKAAEAAVAQKRRQEEYAKEQAELRERQRQYEADRAERKRLQHEEQKRYEAERIEKEEVDKDAFRLRAAAVLENDPDAILKDSAGNRWRKCKFCGKLDAEENFAVYGGSYGNNLGICRECGRKEHPLRAIPVNPVIFQPFQTIPDAMICPECGGTLQEKSGRYGLFIGCSNYPSCRYTRQIRKRK